MGWLAAAVTAMAILAVIDNLDVIASFLTRPSLGGWLLGAGLLVAVVGFLSGQYWLVFLAQNAITLLSTAHAWRGGEGRDLKSIAFLLGLLLVCNLLVGVAVHGARMFRGAA